MKGDDECWIWTGPKAGKKPTEQYGCIWIGGRRWKTHRLAFHFFVRPIAAGEHILHRCDNPSCVNPRHLFAGTHQDNVTDCIQKGRALKERGEDRYNARLKESDIRSIRAAYIPRLVGVRALASRFGVSPSMIFAIVRRKRWKHVS